jgi:hypothetical protein
MKSRARKNRLELAGAATIEHKGEHMKTIISKGVYFFMISTALSICSCSEQEGGDIVRGLAVGIAAAEASPAYSPPTSGYPTAPMTYPTNPTTYPTAPATYPYYPTGYLR